MSPRTGEGAIRVQILAFVCGIASLVSIAASDAGRVRTHHISQLWVADASCETGKTPPNWKFHVGVYQGGIAFYYTTFDSWKLHVPDARSYADAYDAPGWVQAEVAQWGLDNVGRWGCLFHPSVWKYHQ